MESRYQPDTSTGRGRRLETCSKLETCREQHFFSPSCQRRMFFQSGLGLSFTPSLPRTTPSQKQGGERTNELLIAGEQIAEAPLRLPSVQTTCSGLRDCTVVCTLVRLCWDTPHTASAARGRQHLHGRGTCLERVGSRMAACRGHSPLILGGSNPLEPCLAITFTCLFTSLLKTLLFLLPLSFLSYFFQFHALVPR